MLEKLPELPNPILDYSESENFISSNELYQVVSFFEKKMDVSNVGVCQWDADNQLMNINERFLSILGLEDDATFSDIHNRVIDLCYAEDLVKLQDALFALESNKIFHTTLNVRRQISTEMHWYKLILLRGTMSDDDSRFLYSVFCWDITPLQENYMNNAMSDKILKEQHGRVQKEYQSIERENRELKSQLSFLQETLRETYSNVWSWNISNGIIVIEMPSLEGQENSAHAYTIDKIIDKIHPEDLSRIHLDHHASAYAAEHVFTIDLRINYTGKGYNWFEFRGVACQYDKNGMPILLKGVFFDIEERKKKEFELEKKIAYCEQTEKARDAFFSNLSHEIRTPLHAIMGFSDILSKIDQKEERLKYIDVIKTNNDILMKAIEGLVAYADSDTQEDVLKQNKVALWEYMAETQQIYSMKIVKPVKLIFSNSYDGEHIIIDKEKLTQVLDALLLNAIKYTESGVINYSYEYAGNTLIIVVNDTGVGIQPDKLDSLFTRFEKNVSHTISTGINLSICRSLITKMKGTLSVNSYPGEGSSFTIELPLMLEESQPGEISSKSNSPKSLPLDLNPMGIVENISPIRRPVILVAEDVIYSFLMLKTLLEDRFDVIHAENGLQAVELFEKEKPVFVFMDIKMPIMDGIEASRRIRKISQDVPIVVLTAYAVRSLRKEAAEVGCTDMLTRPTTSKQINSVIRKYLKR